MLTVNPISTNLYTNNNCKKPCFRAGTNNQALYAEMDNLMKSLNKADTASGKYRETYLAHILNDLRGAIFKKKRIRLIEALKKLFAEQEKTIEEKNELTNKLNSRVQVLEAHNEAFMSKTRPHTINDPKFGLFRLTPKGLKQYMELLSQLKHACADEECILSSIKIQDTRYNELKTACYIHDQRFDNITAKKLDLLAKQSMIAKTKGDYETKLKVLQNTGELPE